ncbi:MarR family transcriptional regulator [Listeria monocytogenes]|nr:MarR family transcriptional regulator [Listeria monocytogenes]
MSDFSQFGSSEDSYGFVFWQTYTLWHRRIKKELRAFKLTHTQFVILSVIRFLGISSKNISQSDVSSLSKIDVMTISSSIKTLIKNGYIISKGDPNDSRANNLSLTIKGKDVQHKTMLIIENIDNVFFDIEGVDLNAFLSNLLIIHDSNKDDET